MALLYEDETYKIRGAAFEVYKQLGCGHKENVYKSAMKIALEARSLFVELEKQLPVYFNGKKVGVYVPDSMVNKAIIVEYKAKPFTSKEDMKQFWNYLTSTKYELGLLINFGKPGGVEITKRIHKASSEKSVPINSVLDSGSFRVLGIDYGEKRIGLAISDESQTLARELTILSPKEFFNQIKQIIADHQVTAIVLGWPLNLAGEETAQTKKISNFKFQISKKTGLPVETMDERLSSAMTKNLPGGQNNKDSLAAQIILQNYLNRGKNAESDAEKRGKIPSV